MSRICYELFMGCKNLLRHKMRNIFYVTLISLCTGLALYSSSFLQAMSDNWRDEIISSDIGEFQIMDFYYKMEQSALPLNKAIANVDEILSFLKAKYNNYSFTPRVSFAGLASSDYGNAAFFAKGINLDSVFNVLPNIFNHLQEGKELDSNLPNHIVIGKGLAGLLQVNIGDSLLLTIYDSQDAFNATLVQIIGTIELSEQFFNDRLIFMHYKLAQQFTGLENQATEILAKGQITEQIKEQVYKQYNLTSYSWFDLAGSFIQADSMFSFVSLFINSILFGFICILLIAIQVSITLERKQEIGMLIAIGQQRIYIMLLFLTEALLLSIISFILGVFIYKALLLLSSSGISISAPGTSEDITLLLKYSYTSMKYSGISLAIITTISCLYPIYIYSKFQPISILKG